jgi:RNA polymerase sigma-70 factor (ECF subfamily)
MQEPSRHPRGCTRGPCADGRAKISGQPLTRAHTVRASDSRVSSPPTEPITFADQSQWFAREVLPHERPLRSYLRQSLPSLADVDDLVQDCFARMMRARTSGTIRSPKPLLFAIARNAVRDFIERKRRADLIPIMENGEIAVLQEDSDVVELVCRKQELALLAEAIHALPQRCREVLLLRKIKGLPQKEIAALLGIAEHTVEVLAAKGTRRCAEFLRARGIGIES